MTEKLTSSETDYAHPSLSRQALFCATHYKCFDFPINPPYSKSGYCFISIFHTPAGAPDSLHPRRPRPLSAIIVHRTNTQAY
ncbi:protein of unknown function [Thauera humireducens]|nr:protein of unknown function [Thauera humireducens]